VKRLVVNGSDVEGINDLIIAYTKKANDIGDLQTRTGNFTNAFKAPFTTANHVTLQNSFNPNSTTRFPYLIHDVLLYEDGIEVVSGGTMTVRRAAGFYELYVVSGAAAFYKAIAGKKLTDLDLSAHTGPWDPDTQMNLTSGFFFPVLDWGLFNGSSMDIFANLPSVYLHTIVEQIFTDAGYQKAGNIFSAPRYLNMIMPYGRPQFEYDPSFIAPYEFSALKTVNQVNANPPIGTIVLFQDEVKDSDYYNPVTGKYINTTSVTIYSHFFAQFTYSFTGGVGFTIQIRKNGATILAQGTGNPAGGTITLDSRTLFPDGVPVQNTEEVYVMFTNTSGTVTIVAANAKFYNQVLPIPIGSAPLGDTFFGKLLPDMLQEDLMRDVMITFGLVPNEKDGVVSLRSLNEIISDTAGSLDWTGKRTSKIDELSFQPLDYAGNNYFKFTSNSDVSEQVGKGNIQIDNENVDLEKDIYTSPFTNTTTELVSDVLVARIPVFTTSDAKRPFENEPGLRLLLVRDKYSFEPSINGNAAYKVAYFEDPAQADSMSWQQSVDDNYSLLEDALQNAKLIKREYNLTLLDFIAIDFSKPVFDRDAYWLINEVTEFVNGKPVTVELFKL
jgi:hypothetical protein